MQYLSGLVEHLHLFFGVIVVSEDVNLGYHIVSQLVSEFAHCRFLASGKLAVLLLKFSHCAGSGSGCGLVACYVDVFDVRKLLDGFEYHYHHDGGAIGIGDDSSRRIEGILRVALGHYKRNILIHTECA